jgi:hypothetical protein
LSSSSSATGRLGLLDGFFFCCSAWPTGEQAVATGEGVVAGRSAGHQLFAALQARRDAGAVAAVEQGGDQAQGVDRALVFGGGKAGTLKPDQARQLGLHMQGQLALAGLGQFQRQLRRRHVALGDRAEVAGQGLTSSG